MNIRHLSLYFSFGIIVFLVSGLSCASNLRRASESGVIRGIVIDENQMIIRNAKIEVKQIRNGTLQQTSPVIYSDKDGKFDMAIAPNSSILVIIDAIAAGYIKSENYISKSTGSKRLKYTLVQANKIPIDTLIIFGRVVDIKGNPIPAATIQARPYYYGNVSDKNGNFKIERIPLGNNQFKAYGFGYIPLQSSEYLLAKNTVLNINYILTPTKISPHFISNRRAI